MTDRILKFAEWCNTNYTQNSEGFWNKLFFLNSESFTTEELYEKFDKLYPIIDTNLSDVIHNYAKENSINGVDYKIVKKNFSDGIIYQKLINHKASINTAIEKVIRHTITQWASLNEQREKDHEQLVDNWLKTECNDWLIKHIGISLK